MRLSSWLSKLRGDKAEPGAAEPEPPAEGQAAAEGTGLEAPPPSEAAAVEALSTEPAGEAAAITPAASEAATAEDAAAERAPAAAPADEITPPPPEAPPSEPAPSEPAEPVSREPAEAAPAEPRAEEPAAEVEPEPVPAREAEPAPPAAEPASVEPSPVTAAAPLPEAAPEPPRRRLPVDPADTSDPMLTPLEEQPPVQPSVEGMKRRVAAIADQWEAERNAAAEERAAREKLELLLRQEREEHLFQSRTLTSEISVAQQRWRSERASRKRAEARFLAERDRLLEQARALDQEVRRLHDEARADAERDSNRPALDNAPLTEAGAWRAELELAWRDLDAANRALRDERHKRESAEEALRTLADHDPLTDLPTFRVLNDRATLNILYCDRRKEKLALLCLGLDGITVAGAPPGDLDEDVVRSVGTLLKQTLRQGDTVCHSEGYEFLILIPELKRDEDVARVADKLLTAIRGAFNIGEVELRVRASMGIALYPDDGPDMDSMVKCARSAMRRARAEGGDAYVIHAPHVGLAVTARLNAERALRRAFVDGALALHFQPVRDCRTNAVVCMEGLLRWRNPEGKLVPAPDFIAIADAAGLSVPLGQWALRTACAQAQLWHEAGRGEVAVAVNLTARQFEHPALEKLVSRALEETGLAPRFLALEINESELSRDVERAVPRLQALKALGVQVAIDGFGQGHCALGHLSRYAMDTLKIDRSLIRDIATSPREQAIASATVALARALGVRAVAVGVEEEAQRQQLAAWGCELMQGNLCGPPRPPRECDPYLEPSVSQGALASGLPDLPSPRAE